MAKKRLRFQEGKQREFLETVARNEFGSHKEFAQYVGFERHSVLEWRKEKYLLPSSVLDKICARFPEYEKFKEFVWKEMPENWGAKIGGFETAKRIINKGAHYARIREFKALKEIERAKNLKPLIKSNPLIEHLKSEGVDLKAVLAVCLLMDGSMQVQGNHYRISYASKDEVLLDVLFSLINEVSERVPTVSFAKKANSVRVSDSRLGQELLKMSPNFKTSPSRHQTKEEYFGEPQPTLGFLACANLPTKVWAARFGMSADGYIGYSRGKAELGISCYHPTLAVEWKNFLTELGVSCRIRENKASWCGISDVRTSVSKSINAFFQMGGFVDGVKISKKSKRFVGMTKNELLERVVSGDRGI